MRKTRIVSFVLAALLIAAACSACAPRDLAAEIDAAIPGVTLAPLEKREAEVTPAYTEYLPTPEPTLVPAPTETPAGAATPTPVPTATPVPTPTPVVRDGKKWTVMVYICGTDLETQSGAATANIAEMLKAELGENVKVLIETGGTKLWRNSAVTSDSIGRFKIVDGELKRQGSIALSSMGDAATLGSFLKWGIKECPADKYAAVIWNHGGGVLSGVAFDELYANDSLTLLELGTAFKAAGEKFEFIGLDCCLMAALETAQTLSPYAYYMVASQEYEPGGGWDYKEWLSYLGSNPDFTGNEIGRRIADTYYEKCDAAGCGGMATLSVVDLGKIDALSGAFDEMAKEMTGLTGDIAKLKSFTQGAVRAENYGSNNPEEGYTNLVDLGGLVLNTENVLNDTGDRVLDCLFDAVTYNVKGRGRTESNGLSVFYPLSVGKAECAQYSELSQSKPYLRFIDALVSDWSQDGTGSTDGTDGGQAEGVPEYKIVYTTRVADGEFELSITQGLEAVTSVGLNLYYKDYKNGEYILLGNANDVRSDWAAGTFTDGLTGDWLTLGGVYCSPSLIYESEYYNLYSVPIYLDSERTNLRLCYDKATGKYENLGLWEGIDTATGMSSRNTGHLRDGDYVQPIFYSMPASDGSVRTYTLSGFYVRGDVAICEEPLLDGEYMYQFEIRDVFSREYLTNTAKMTRKGGTDTISD